MKPLRIKDPNGLYEIVVKQFSPIKRLIVFQIITTNTLLPIGAMENKRELTIILFGSTFPLISFFNKKWYVVGSIVYRHIGIKLPIFNWQAGPSVVMNRQLFSKFTSEE